MKTNANTGFSVSLTTGLLAAAALSLAGCKSEQTSFESIANDLTPELSGVTQRPVDVDMNLALMENANWRMFSDDLGRVFYTDHPSRLSPFPIMSLNGQPR